MRHHRYIVFILDGCGYGYGSRTATETVALEQPVAEVLVHVLAAVCGDIDVFRVKLPQSIYGFVQLLDACAFQRWQYFKRESCLLVALYRSIILISFSLSLLGEQNLFVHWEQK